MTRRVEFTVPEEMWQRLEAARGDVSRARFIKRAVEEKLNGGPTFVIDGSLVAAAKPVPLKFSPEEERAHAEAQRREASRQMVSEPKAEQFDAQAAAMERQRKMNESREKRK